MKQNKKYIRVVNHGKVFGKEDWYTFYCGTCGNQVWDIKDLKICSRCGEKLIMKEGK